MEDVPVDAVAAAARGEVGAWNDLVDRYTPLVISVIRRYRLGADDTADVNQTVWLRLVEHLGRIREPQALPKWIITTTRNECLRLLRSRRHVETVDPLLLWEAADESDDIEPDTDLLREERHQVLRDGFAQLSARCRELLALLVTDPPLRYTEISERLGMPRGSIGVTRSRCLEKLRNSPAVVAFLTAVREDDGSGGGVYDLGTAG